MAENRRLPIEDQRQLDYLLKQLADKDKQLADKDKQLADKDEQLADKDEQLADKDKQLADKDEQLADKDKQLADKDEQLKREEERSRPTTLEELLQLAHELLSRQLRPGTPSRSTQGTIPAPTNKFCPDELRYWSEFPGHQKDIFDRVCHFLRSENGEALRLFHPRTYLEELSKRVASKTICSEGDLDRYEGMAVEEPVSSIITELCKIPAAREHFGLTDGVSFENHANMLEREENGSDLRSGTGRNRPDRYCVHRKDANADSNPSNGLIATVELKPPHKLSERHLRVGLRPMNFWYEVAQQDKIPTDKDEKAKRNAELLTGSTLAQEYDVMLQEGLEFSYISNGFAYVFLQVRKDEPGTLYFYLCEPNMDMVQEDSGISRSRIERTAIARVLCFCLMCLQSKVRDNAVRAQMMSHRQKWVVSFDRERAQIPREELAQTPPDSEYSIPDDSGSEFLPSSPPSECVAEGRRIPTRSMTNSCRSPEESSSRPPHADSSDSDDVPAAQGRKRGFSQVTSSPTSERASSTRSAGSSTGQQRGQDQRHAAHFCTQRCLLGLRQGGRLDDACPNVDLHRQGLDGDRHPIDAGQLVQMLKRQLDRDPDHGCTPVGRCGSYGAPFRITCATYGYTVIGKGTTSCLWGEVSREAEIYRILQKVQGLAVPVFLGAIDLAQIYFLHGAGRIQHMLLMGWAGQRIRSVEAGSTLSGEISRSRKQLRLCGVVHEDLRLDNMLWNEELGRVLIIDFHRCRIDRRPTQERIQSLKRRSRLAPKDWPKRPRQDAESVHHG